MTTQFPPGDWTTLGQAILQHAEADNLGGAQTGALAFTAVHQTLAVVLAWLGTFLEQRTAATVTGAATTGAAQGVATLNPRFDQVLANENTNKTALSVQLEAARDRIIAEISGGAGGSSDVLVPVLTRLADVIIANEDRLEPILFSLLTRIADSINGISGGQGALSKALISAVVPALQEITVQLANTGAADVAQAVTDATDEQKTGTAGILEQLEKVTHELTADNPDLVSAFTQAGVPNFKGILGTLSTLVAGFAIGKPIAEDLMGKKLTELLPEQAKQILALGEQLLVGVAGHVVHGIEATHVPMRATMGGLASLFFETIDGELATLGQSDEDTVLPKAKELLTIAASLGATAHLFSIAAESAHGAKHLGLNLFGAFLTDLAGFQKIADHSFGVQYEAALRSPARRRANKRFRAEQPMIGDITQMWYEGRISEEVLRRYLAEQGWEDFWIDAYVLMAPIEASPRDLALVFEDGDVDLEWAIGHLTERGFLREDAERIANGVRTKSLKSARQQAITNVMNAYEDGLVDTSAVLERLRPLRLSDDAIQLYLLGSDMTRFRAERRELRAELLAQASSGLVDDTDVATTLAAWGYDPRAQQHTASIARARKQRRVLQEEAADTKAATRRRQADELNVAQEQYRRFQLDDAGLAAKLTAAGVADDEVSALVALARVRRSPTPKLAEVLTPEAQAQRALEQEADRVTTLLRKGTIDTATAQASLIGLGVDPDDARRRVNLAAAQGTKAPDRFTGRPINAVVEEARRVKMKAAREAFRDGLLTLEQLGQQLGAAGIEAPVVAAVVEFEDNKRRGDEASAAQRQADQASAAALRGHRDEVVAAFRAGDLDEQGLLANLLAVGVPPSQAEAITSSEVQRRDQGEAAQDEAAAERTAGQDQKLREDAVLFGLRNGLVDDGQALELLAQAGVTETRATLLVQRELARKKPPKL